MLKTLNMIIAELVAFMAAGAAVILEAQDVVQR